ncbi:aryl-alcohol dehydrogenase [Marinobacterium nitratireducens]|uniref:Aryl-alcohol dehydrogenase n=1 Tax=Marinobacterium nitratireducens TaxID=518897 RepID=A0A917ZMM9_9GAMM|nr:aldo/keto reductase [Marinobacterium nitratireducens]GGO87355.1 aryl-alcohol dehydrogenase [Marinobacterium nitratireducens]
MLVSHGVVDTPLVLGMMRLCEQKQLCQPAALADWIGRRLEQGLSWFDHADIYGDGRCEELFGAALASRPELRSKVRLIGKSDIVKPQPGAAGVSHYDTSAEHLVAAVDGTLGRLGVERLDLFLLHRPDPLMDPEATARVLERLLHSGKVAQLGVSNFLPEQWRLLQQALGARLCCNQIELSLRASQPLFNGISEAQQRDGLQLLAWSPLAGGRLEEERLGERLAELSAQAGCGAVGLAMAWLRRIPGQPVPVLGSFSEERIADALAGCELDMSRQDWFALLEAGRGHRVA